MNPVEHVIYKLRNAEVRPYPFPHFYVEDVFPADFYAQLREELPADDRYKQLSADYKERLITDGAEAPLLTPFATDYFLNSVFSVFAPPSDAQSLGLRGEWRLVRDREGYQIQPHTDGAWKVISLLFYLPADDRDRAHGTSIYVPRDHAMTCKGGKHWGREPFDLVYTAPYVPNSCFGFWKTDYSWHGVEKIEGAIRRDVALYNVYKGKR